MRVLIADESPSFRAFLRHILELECDLSVVGEVADGMCRAACRPSGLGRSMWLLYSTTIRDWRTHLESSPRTLCFPISWLLPL